MIGFLWQISLGSSEFLWEAFPWIQTDGSDWKELSLFAFNEVYLQYEQPERVQMFNNNKMIA